MKGTRLKPSIINLKSKMASGHSFDCPNCHNTMFVGGFDPKLKRFYGWCQTCDEHFKVGCSGHPLEAKCPVQQI